MFPVKPRMRACGYFSKLLKSWVFAASPALNSRKDSIISGSDNLTSLLSNQIKLPKHTSRIFESISGRIAPAV